MLLRVELEGQPYLVDVGFCGLTLTAPLRVAPDIAQTTPHAAFRLILDGDTYLLQAYVQQVWRALYSFDLQEQPLPDYAVSSWYLFHQRESQLVTGLIAARPDVDKRYALRNNQLAVR